MADTKKRITSYPTVTVIGEDDYVMLDNGRANGTKKILASALGGKDASLVEIIMGDLDRVYGTTPANYIGTFNQWDSIDSGKSFSDYDEIIIVMCPQNDDSASGAKSRFFYSIPVYVLEYYDKVYSEYTNGNVAYTKYALDYTNNKFYLSNFNYCCPIALVGVKYSGESASSDGSSSYTETELFSDGSGVDTGDMSLDGDIFDYDAFIFEVNDSENESSHVTLPASAFTQGTSCNIGGVSKAGAFWFQLEMQDSGTIAINACASGFKIYSITGIKY
jgi:hypothetical protein